MHTAVLFEGVKVNVFVIAPRPAGSPPVPGFSFDVDERSVDRARRAASVQLEASGNRVRALTCGPSGLVAYVEEVSRVGG